ncbi:MAG: TetR/AcrR family transcriptional regulator, partial [Chloroflexota bacterium]|nr:TetR/AcrR family transcriptional regulator [Chloroflexota bacterium]
PPPTGTLLDCAFNQVYTEAMERLPIDASRVEPDRRTQILDAAFEEFAAKGFRGATIKSIATAAGLQSPALIYWYFPTKEALFQAALESKVLFLPLFEDPAALLDRPPEQVLTALARAYLATFDQPIARQLVRLALSEAVQRPELVEVFAERGPTRVLRLLSGYLERQVELGRLRPHDTRAAARAMMGMLVVQAVGKMVLPQLQEDGLTDEEHVHTSVGLFLRGLAPDQ